MNADYHNAIKICLSVLDGLHQKLEGRGAILSGPKGYLSGSPYLLSTDHKRAFAVKNKAQAAAFRELFLESLEQFIPVELNS